MNIQRSSTNQRAGSGSAFLRQLRSRRVSDDPMEIDYSGSISGTSDLRPPAQFKSNNLLEDWPRRVSCYSTEDMEDMQQGPLPKGVDFSDFSQLRIFLPDTTYTKSKAYNPEERKDFKMEALREAVRIKRLITSTPAPSMRESLKYLLKNKVLAPEEIVGIEHLVFSKSVTQVCRARKAHVQAVVQKQHELQQGQRDSTKKLGDYSASRSIKYVKHARVRAAMAA